MLLEVQNPKVNQICWHVSSSEIQSDFLISLFFVPLVKLWFLCKKRTVGH